MGDKQLILDTAKRSKGLDFLRGIAVLLVLCSHHWFYQPINNIGWVGVDLFFVLSGFLVSGLLFNEYKVFGNIKPGLFLIRRGFKIYPLFYFAILLSVLLIAITPYSYVFPESQKLFLNSNGLLIGLLVESFFLQSYFYGLWGHTWSLSVEEIFYFSLVLIVLLVVGKNMLPDVRKINLLLGGVLVGIFLLRCMQASLWPISIANYRSFHLRCDSLFFGVWISYYYCFHLEQLRAFYHKYKILMRVIFFPLVCFLPFYNSLDSLFVLTIGFTWVYVAAGILLLHFLFANIDFDTGNPFLGKALGWISSIGFYSYSIYLFHYFVVRFVVGEDYPLTAYQTGHYSYVDVLLSFLIYLGLSIGLGIGLSRLIEIPMLRLRDMYYPRRTR